MKEYREFQSGSLMLAILIPSHILLIILYFARIGTRPIDFNGFMFLNITFGLMYLLFYRMTTVITDEKVRVSFGVGLIWRNIEFNKILSAVAVKNPWYYGLGIHLIPNGMLFNVSGSGAVELTLKSNGRVFRIGTKNSLQLRDEIVKRLAPQT